MDSTHEALLKGTVAIVTGASSGVGWATAKLFASRGVKVVATARREDRLNQLCREIADEGGEAVFHSGDAANVQTAKSAISLALGRFGRLDAVICNAGQGNYKQLVDTSPQEFDELMNSNMRSSFLFARFAAPHFLAQRRGTLLFISSVAGLAGAANESVYCATKFAQVGFAQALDAELRPFGIKVGVLCPGGIKTEFAIGKGRTEESVATSSMLDPIEVANAIWYACAQPANVRVVQMTVRNMGTPPR
ncbi:SDR family oxidoreductase [Bryocella elongata]|uniref:SDR family oxidoreductase n=1 Tax=Bryocella elongata TaxID=863522 RepID=UPI001F403D14|nr:SDR family oxidoreductase [Bryocella elongata]